MPRETLTREQIVATAIELLDEEGLDGLNMRSLGKRLDSAPTAMYWHVKNKDNLIRLAADETWGEIALPDPGSPDWRAAAEQLARGLYTTITSHPWLAQAQSSYLLYGPNKARHDEVSLTVYENAGFVDDAADQAMGAVFTLILGSAAGAAADVSLRRRLGRGDRDPAVELQAALDEASEIAQPYPRLRARLERADMDTLTAVASFEFGLAALLDGLAERLPSG
ncbi:TetR/AcrR family transcriptional regulator C-terminal domain-containing protein [Nocardia sp. NPDC058518]|uniref:TetR/AcrR family transcriptional regulator C-terminal domain-containing protein n=1 Tax=Nocardia sp. NPDC058518 TaxID=3346534 RepID=UPI0036529DE4